MSFEIGSRAAAACQWSLALEAVAKLADQLRAGFRQGVTR